MDRGIGKEAGIRPRGADCDFQETDWAMAGKRMRDIATPAQQPRKRTLAGNDPHFADLLMAFDLLDDAVLLLQQDGQLVHLNQAATALAIPAKSGAATSLHTLGPKQPWGTAAALLREYQQTGGCNERMVRDPGTGKCWLLRLAPLACPGAIPPRLVLLLRDATVTEDLNRQLRGREVMAEVGTLLAGAAHQARNTLFGLSATLEAFESRLQRRASEQDYVDGLRAGIIQMQALLRDLLDYANPVRDGEEVVPLAEIVRSSAGACRPLAAKMAVRITLDAAAEGRVKANPVRLARALENVIENAIQHSPRDGAVTLRLLRPPGGDVLRLEIADHGPGFAPECLEKAFVPFFTRRPAGTGLGLTIAQRTIEAMRGSIQLLNRPEGGASVTVSLPAYRELEAPLLHRSVEGHA